MGDEKAIKRTQPARTQKREENRVVPGGRTAVDEPVISLCGNPGSAARTEIKYDNFRHRGGMLWNSDIEKRPGHGGKGMHDLEQQFRQEPIRLIVNGGQPHTDRARSKCN